MARGRKSDKDSGHSFEDYFKRAASPMLVLYLLSQEPMYVYQMTQELERRSFGVHTLSLLYPVIYRLVDQGYLVEGEKQISPDNRVRQYYCITAAGREYLHSLFPRYLKLHQAVLDIMDAGTDLGGTNR